MKGFMVLPVDPTVPIVCIGPGTGIAPMRAIIQNRIFSRNGRLQGSKEMLASKPYASGMSISVIFRDTLLPSFLPFRRDPLCVGISSL